MKLVYIIIISIIILTLLYPFNKTGKLGSQSTERIVVEVAPAILVLKTTVDKSVYCLGETVQITNILTNYNYSSISGNLSTKLVSQETQTQVFFHSLNDTISARENKAYKVNYTLNQSDPRGWYRAIGNFSYNNDLNFTSDYTEFDVWGGIGYLIGSPARIEKTIPAGNHSTQTISMWLDKACQNTTAFLNATTGIPGDWVSFSPDKVFLSTTQLNTSIANISVPSNIGEGNYTGEVFVYANGQRVRIPLVVHVSANVFDLSISIPSTKKEVCPGDEVYVVVNITKIKPIGVVDINMTYQILDSSWAVLDEKKETIAINTTVERIPTLHVPSSASPGYYTFLAILNFETSVVQSSDTFRVISCVLPPAPTAAPEAPAVPGLAVLPRPKLALNLSTDRLWVLTGNKTSFIATVKNLGTATVKSVRILIEGIPTEWFNIVPGRTDISIEKTQEYLILIDVPKDAKPGTYLLNVTAIDDVKSETRQLQLFVGANYKQIADLMLEQLGNLRKKSNEIQSLKECSDVSEAIRIVDEAERLTEKGMSEYEKKDFEKAVYWFDYAISSFKRALEKTDVIIEAKIESLKGMNTFSRILYEKEINYHLTSARIYLHSRDYVEFCGPILIVERLQFNGGIIMLAVLGLLIVIAILIGVIVKMYKRKKELERGILLRRVKERLEKIGVETG
jgi:hypothetical protein